MASRIHPTAVIDPAAMLAEDVCIGPFVVIDGPVVVGSGCTLRPHAHLIGPLTLGAGNDVGTGVVLGDRPQHLSCTISRGVVIGDGNTFREHVTVHRGTAADTRIGHRNYFMANSHVAHDCVIADNVIMANGSLLAGHVIVDSNVFISGNAAVHQRTRLGRYCFLGGGSATTRDVPPFIMQQHYNEVVNVNVVGMRRGGFTAEQIDGVRRAYRILYMQGNTIRHGVETAEREFGHIDTVAEMLAFIRSSANGVNNAGANYTRQAA